VNALLEYVKRDSLRDEVLDMREKMRAELCMRDDATFDLKQGEGGIVDIEFLVQYLVLLNAPRDPRLIHYSDNIRQLEALENAGILASEDAEWLANSYRTYRERGHRLSLSGDARTVPADEFIDLRTHVVRIWTTVFGG
jgi:glutamate-ammonia-ligase adenylyltransferase